MQTELQRTERIDGTDFVVGSLDHTRAVEERETRRDAAFVEEHHADVEAWGRFLRSWEAFHHRNDANDVAFFGTQLVAMRGRIERVIQEKLRMREFLDMETGYDRGAQVYGKEIEDDGGSAEVGRMIADDAPAVDVESRVEFDPFVWVYSMYEWTAEELDADNFARRGRSILQRKSEAMAKRIMEKLDKVGRSGSAKNNLYGLFNSPSVTVHTYTNGEHSSTGTAAEILADLNELETTVVAVLGDHADDHEFALVAPTAVEARYRQLAAHAATDLSVRDWFLSRSRLIKRIVPYAFLDDAVLPDIAASDAPMSLLMPVKPGTTIVDPETCIWPVSVPYEERRPKDMGERMRVRGASRVAGVDFRHPKRCLYIHNND